MSNFEQALIINHNLDAQSRYLPQGDTFEYINQSRQRNNDMRVINAINRDIQLCSQKVNNLKP